MRSTGGRWTKRRKRRKGTGLNVASARDWQMAKTEIPYPYIVRRKLASGKWKDYYRFRREGTDTALPGAPGDAEFHAKYASPGAPVRELGKAHVLTPFTNAHLVCRLLL